MKMQHSVPKRLPIKFRRGGFTQKIEYNIDTTAKFVIINKIFYSEDWGSR